MIGIASMGAGPMARTHAKAISAAGGRLITVYDVVESAAKSLATDAAHLWRIVQKRHWIALTLLPSWWITTRTLREPILNREMWS
jgi:ornithine cyclodeaminase/alanine dehydrogenase-like protein (mu-crystallin family)